MTLRLAHGMERRRPLAAPDQIGVAVILEDRHAVFLRQRQEFAPPRFIQDRAGRILHGRNRINIFRADALAPEVFERLRKRIHAHAAAVKRNADGIDAEPIKPCQRALIGRLLDDDGVAARQQDAVDQIERLQRTGRDQDFAGMARDARGPFEFLRQEFTQPE